MQARYDNVLIFKRAITLKLQFIYVAMDCKATSFSTNVVIMKTRTPSTAKCVKIKNDIDKRIVVTKKK